MARHHFVAHQLFELGNRDLERGVDLVGRLVERPPRLIAGAADVVHGTGEPGVLDRQELDVGPRDPVEFFRQIGHDVGGRAGLELGDKGSRERRDRRRRHHAIGAPGIHRLENPLLVVGRVACAGQEFGQQGALGPWIGWRRRHRGRRLHRPRVGYGFAAAEGLHREIPHHLHAQAEPGEKVTANARFRGAHLGHARNGGWKIDLLQISVDRLEVGCVGRDPSRAADGGRGGVGVGLWKFLIGKPGIGDKAPRSGRVHHITTPQGVDAEDGLGDAAVKIGLCHQKASGLSVASTP